MKTVIASLFVLALTTVSAPAFADWGRRDCEVSFKKCDFNINGFCVKWNKKRYEVDRREARWACERAEERYGMIKNCNVDCY